MLGGMEALPGRGKNQVQNLNRSQELGILHDKPEVEQTASKMGIIPIKIQLYIKVCSRK